VEPHYVLFMFVMMEYCLSFVSNFDFVISFLIWFYIRLIGK
jgi:hypothetical protein